MQKEITEFQPVFSFEKEKQTNKQEQPKPHKDSEAEVFYHIFESDILDPNPCTVTQ